MSARVGRADIPAYFLGAQRAVSPRNLCGPEGPKRLRWMGLGCRHHLPLHCVILENSRGNMWWELEETQEMISLCNIDQRITWKLPKNKIEDKCEGDRGMSLLFHLEMPRGGWWDLCADGPAESSVGWIVRTLAGCTKWQIQYPVVYPNHTSTSQEVTE